MAKKINFGEVKEGVIKALSEYNVSWLTEKTRKAAAKKAVEDAEKALEAARATAAAAEAAGVSEAEAYGMAGVAERRAAFNMAEDALAGLRLRIRDERKAALSLVPEEMYAAYTTREAAPEGYVHTVEQFLNNLGLTANEAALRRFAEDLTALIGARKSTGKTREAGHYIQDYSKGQFRDLAILALMEHLINKKGVLDMAEDGSLSRHVFEEEGQGGLAPDEEPSGVTLDEEDEFEEATVTATSVNDEEQTA